jgi:hypothetical protein
VEAKAWKVEPPRDEFEGEDGLPYPFTRIPVQKELSDGKSTD